VNAISSEITVVVGADVIGRIAGNSELMVILTTIHQETPTGVAGVGEYIEI
jgi:hypothetical protein